MRWLVIAIAAQAGCHQYWVREDVAQRLETHERGPARLAVPATRDDGRPAWLDFGRIKVTSERSYGVRRVQTSTHALTINGAVSFTVGALVMIAGAWAGAADLQCVDDCGAPWLLLLSEPIGGAALLTGIGLMIGGAFHDPINPDRRGFRRLSLAPGPSPISKPPGL